MDLDHCPDCGQPAVNFSTSMCQHQHGKYTVYYGMRVGDTYFINVFIRSSIGGKRVLFFKDRWFKLDEERIEMILVMK